MPSGKKLVLFTCLAGCVVIAGALATMHYPITNKRELRHQPLQNRQSSLAPVTFQAGAIQKPVDRSGWRYPPHRR